MLRTRTNPAIIRLALVLVDQHSGYYASKKLGIDHRTIYRWVKRREALGPDWPTDADIAAWREDTRAKAQLRKYRAEQARKYRKDRYLNRGRPLCLPALGVARRLQALYAIGYTQSDLGKALGVTAPRVANLMHHRYDVVYRHTFIAVDAVFRELCMKVPEDPEPMRRGQVRVHARARRDAQARGWAPPLAWDNIDDPHETPKWRSPSQQGGDHSAVQRRLNGDKSVGLTPEERVEVVAACLRRGMTHNQITEVTGIAHPSRYYPREDTAA